MNVIMTASTQGPTYTPLIGRGGSDIVVLIRVRTPGDTISK